MSVYTDLFSPFALLFLFLAAGSLLELAFGALERRAGAVAPDRVRESRSGRKPVRVRH